MITIDVGAAAGPAATRITKKQSLCKQCGADLAHLAQTKDASMAAWLAQMQNSFEKRVEGIVARDPRYSAEAYTFVSDALWRAIEATRSRNVTAAESLDEMRLLAIERFGLNAREQLRAWGITRCEDFGEIVFSMIDLGIFGQGPDDKKEDFIDGYDFDSAFPLS
jgi:uncharacterized repeat protein (TIGR04138 family)